MYRTHYIMMLKQGLVNIQSRFRRGGQRRIPAILHHRTRRNILAKIQRQSHKIIRWTRDQFQRRARLGLWYFNDTLVEVGVQASSILRRAIRPFQIPVAFDGCGHTGAHKPVSRKSKIGTQAARSPPSFTRFSSRQAEIWSCHWTGPPLC